MRESEISAMGEQERFYWWHVCRRLVWRSIFDRWLPTLPDRSILDVGCGAGFNLEFLKKWGQVTGVDQSEAALLSAKQYGAAEKGDALHLPRPDATVDLITAFDVLEHLTDDLAGLQEWHRVLKSQGYVAISVPAYQWLYGPHDKTLLHQRRYTASELSSKLVQAGFKPVFSSYVFMFAFPVFVAQRLLAKSLDRGAGYNLAPTIVNQLLIGLGQLEAGLVKFVSLPFGSSIFILAQKI